MTNDGQADSAADSVSGSDVSRRGYLRTAAGAAAVSTGVGTFAGSAAANPITAENRKDGDDDWYPSLPIRSRPERMTHRVEGYTSQTSIAPGETVEFHVSTDPAAPYRVDVYRLGWIVAGRRRKPTGARRVGSAFVALAGRLVTRREILSEGAVSRIQPRHQPAVWRFIRVQ